MEDKNLIQELAKNKKLYFYNYEPNFDDGILKKHNIEVYKKIIKGFTKGNKVLFEQATGTGKTYVTLKFLHDHAVGKRVLVVTPSHAIKDSFIDTYRSTLGKDFDCDLHMSLYQGLRAVKDKNYDIIVFDEAHRLGAKTWGQNAEELIKNNPNATILGMTATLERPDKVDVKKYFDGKNPVSKITLVQALERGILPNPDYTLAKVDFADDDEFIDSSIRELNERLSTADTEEKEEIKNFIRRLKEAKNEIHKSDEIEDIFHKELNTDELKRGKFIVFCPAGEEEEETIESLHKMKGIMKESSNWFDKIDGIKKIKKYSVYSKLGRNRNKQIIKNFERDDSKALKLLFSINMLNEGLHVSDIDGVIMMRTTGSRIIYLQQLGRALSVGHKHKPKILDLVANLNYVDVLDLQKSAKAINKARGDGHGDGFVDGPMDDEILDFTLSVYNLEAMQLIDTLKKNIFDFEHKFDFDFEDFKNRIIRWKERTEDLKIKQRDTDIDGYPIGQKLTSIKQGLIKLTDKQIDELIELGLNLTVKKVEKTNLFVYEDFRDRIIRWKERNGNLNIKYDDTDIDGYPIGIKISMIKSGQIKLTDAQREELIALGLDLTVKEIDKNNRFDYKDFKQRIIDWKEREGDVRIKKDALDIDGYTIYQKLQSIRYGNIKLTDAQRDELISLGLDLTVKKTKKGYRFDYKDFRQRIIDWKEREGDVRIKRNALDIDGYTIYQKLQDIKHGKIKLTDEQRDELIALGLDLTVKNIDKVNVFVYEDFKNRIKAWKKRNGDVNIKQTDKDIDGYPIGQKLSSIKKGNIKLTDAQRDELIALGLDLTVKKRKNTVEDSKESGSEINH